MDTMSSKSQHRPYQLQEIEWMVLILMAFLGTVILLGYTLSKLDTAPEPLYRTRYLETRDVGTQVQEAPKRCTLGKRIMSLPMEIRLRIFAEICAPFQPVNKLGGFKGWSWYPWFLKIPREITSQGVPAYYGSKKLIIELPEFTTRRDWTQSPIQWPSALRMYDTENELNLELGTSTVFEHYGGVPRHLGFINLFELMVCPFYLFSGITIKVPPYYDWVSLTVNWCRLRFIGHILGELEKARQQAKWGFTRDYFNPPDRLTPINIVFTNGTSWSWLNVDGRPKLCPKLSDNLKLEGDESSPSSLVVLLRALRPIKGSAEIKVHSPDGFPESELQRKFSATWFMDHQSQGHHDDVGLDQIDSELDRWLERCEQAMSLQFHIITQFYPMPRCISNGRHPDFKAASPLPYLGSQRHSAQIQSLRLIKESEP